MTVSKMAARDSSQLFAMEKLLVFLLLTVSYSSSEEQMVVVHSPEDLTFHSGEYVRLSQLPDILSAVWDFTAVKDQKWTGLDSGNPLKRPEAIVVVEVEGFQSVNRKIGSVKFPLETDVEPGWPFELIADRTYVRFAEKNPILLEIINDDSIYNAKSQYSSLLKTLPARPSDLEDKVLDDASLLEGHPTSSLNATLTPDMKFLMDVELVYETAKIIKDKSSMVKDGVPDLYWFRVTGLQELLTVYDVNSSQIDEATDIVMQMINKVNKLFAKAYNGNMLFLLLGVNYQSGGIVRVGRDLLAESTTASPDPVEKDFNLVAPYNENYPVIFNIIFLTMLIFSLSIFAISLGIWHMDPGRDSIIYRMTSQRMKKDQ